MWYAWPDNSDCVCAIFVGHVVHVVTQRFEELQNPVERVFLLLIFNFPSSFCWKPL